MPSGLTYQEHLRIARLALERSWVAPDAVSDVVCRLAASTEPLALDSVWVRTGLLSAEQLAEAQSPPSGALDCDPTTPTVQLFGSPPAAAFPVGGPAGGSEVEDAEGGLSLLAAPVDLRYWQRCMLGEGGHGRVHRCIDVVLKRPVAVKTTQAELVGDEETERLLERESRILARLEHPNIIPIYDAGRDPERGPFYVMREVEQLSLEHVLERLRNGDAQTAREFTQKRLLRQLIQISRAIDFANSRGVTHCDLKPANILLGSFGQVLVADWGMAAVESEPYRPHGGTHGFMAPEQYSLLGRVDARTDVFALGAILYQVLTYQPAIGDDVAPPRPGMMTAWTPPPIVPPSQRASALRVAPELDAVCLRAMDPDPDKRYPRAGALGDAVEQFLEGTLELERRAAEADRQVEAARELASHYLELDEARPGSLAQLTALRRCVPPWAPLADKRSQWEMEDMVQITDALRVRTFQAAVAAFEQALDAVPHDARARRGLAELYWKEREHARRRRDESNRIYFQQLVEQHDDGALLGESGAAASLSIRRCAKDAQVELETYREVDRRWVVAETRKIESSELHALTLAPGNYRVVARRGPHRLVVPVALAAGQSATVEVDLEEVAGLGADEVWIAGGVALLGGVEGMDATDPRDVHVPGFAIQRFPVTFEEYATFLDQLGGVSVPESHVPRSDLGQPILERVGSSWRLRAGIAPVGMAEPSRLPVFGVSALGATAYAEWLSARTGRSYRLPADDEWEKAGRGVDGRLYPWGNHFDATFCCMRISRPGASSLSPVGAFNADESPFGVRDLAGGVADWTVPTRSGETDAEVAPIVHSRGGAWCDPAMDCRLASRQEYCVGARSQRVGFRLVWSPT